MRKRRVNKRIVLTSLLLLALPLDFGCTKKQEAPAPQPQVKAAAPQAAPPVQAQVSSAKLSRSSGQPLDFSNKKDPFRPFTPEPMPQARAKSVPSARTADLLPIQSYEVNKFRVSGIIAGLKENTALIIDPAGKGYVVREGMLIGLNDGRITRITSSAIEVVEQYRDNNGHLRKRNILLTLPKKKQGDSR